MMIPEQIRLEVADHMIRITAPIIFAGILISGVTLFLLDDGQYQRLIPTLIAIIIMLPSWILNRMGKTMTGSAFMLTGIFCGILFGMYLNGGVRAPAFIAALPLTSILIVLYGTRGGIAAFVFCLTAGTVFCALEYHHLLQPVPSPPMIFYFLLILIYVVMQIRFVMVPVQLMIRTHSDAQRQMAKAKTARTNEMATASRLMAEERRFQEMIKNASDTVIIMNKDGVQTYVSNAAERHLGYPVEELMGINVIDTMIHPEDKAHVLAMFQSILNTGTGRVQYRHRHQNGSFVHLEATGSNQLDNPDIQGVVVNIRNINEWKQTEQKLREIQDLFLLITGQTSALVSIIDGNGRYIFASPSHRTLGYEPEQLMGQNAFFMMVEDGFSQVVKKLADQRKEESAKTIFSFQLADTGAGIHFFRGIFDAAYTQEGELKQIVCVADDITELRSAQEEKIKAVTLAAETKKMALVGQIAGKMAHDFNNVLGTIMGNAELGLLDCEEENTRKILQMIFTQTIRGRNLTKNLVAFAKDHEPRQMFFAVDKKIELVLDLMKKDIGHIRINRFFDENIPELLADPGMIEHAFINIIQNAIHALSLVENPNITIRTGRTKTHILIEFEDNGCGIPESHLNDVFEPSFTLKGSRDQEGHYHPNIKGTGYGMSNVKRYVEQHNGIIRLTSNVKVGTKIEISLPIMETQLSKEDQATIVQDRFIQHKRILLVEDEPAISDVQLRILKAPPCSHQVDLAEDGPQTILALKKKHYDLVSLDYVLPGDQNGMDLYHYIRNHFPDLPVLFNSGNFEFIESVKTMKIKDPLMDHLAKPARNIDYLRAVNTLLTARFPET